MPPLSSSSNCWSHTLVYKNATSPRRTQWLTVYRHKAWHPTPSVHHSIQTQDMIPHPITVYRHRTWHPTPSQYTDTRHDTPPHQCITVYRHRTWHPPYHSIQTQDIWHPTPSQYTYTGHDTHPITVYRHRTWHPTPSQHTDTGHDTPPHHSIQTQDMAPHPVTVYIHRAWHPPYHSIQTQDMTPTLSQYTDTGHGTPPHHSIQLAIQRSYKILRSELNTVTVTFCYVTSWGTGKHPNINVETQIPLELNIIINIDHDTRVEAQIPLALELKLNHKDIMYTRTVSVCAFTL